MAHAGLIILILVLLVLLAAGAYILLTRLRASRSGLPPPPLSSYIPFRASNSPAYPSPAPSSILDWAREKLAALRNRRTTHGGYEEPLGRGSGRGGRGRAGFGPLDPDGAWDARVGNEADGAYGGGGGVGGGYYEEQELGLHPISTAGNTDTHYGGAELPAYDGEEMGRGRSRSRDASGYIAGGQRGLDERYEEAMGADNPFADGAESSGLRGVSSRPVEGEGAKGHRVVGSTGSGGSGGEERKSMFHENM